jgi:hypothetical protein
MDPTSFIEIIASTGEFLIALGSLLGFIGVVLGILSLFVLGKYSRKYSILIIVCSGILLIICGPTTGLEYFNIGL